MAGEGLSLLPVIAGREPEQFIRQTRDYSKSHGGLLEDVPIGLATRTSLQVVVGTRTGIVSIEDWERRTFRPIAPSLVSLIDSLWQPAPA